MVFQVNLRLSPRRDLEAAICMSNFKGVDEYYCVESGNCRRERRKNNSEEEKRESVNG
jgi:hypothetical protein